MLICFYTPVSFFKIMHLRFCHGSSVGKFLPNLITASRAIFKDYGDVFRMKDDHILKLHTATNPSLILFQSIFLHHSVS